MLFKRLVHTVPRLANIEQLSKNGIPRVLSARGFDIAWNETQKFLCDKLTLATAGSSLESYYPFHIVQRTAGKRHLAHVFNWASAAHNNHLFIENIIHNQDPAAEASGPSRALQSRLDSSFPGQTWEQIVDSMVASAERNVVGEGWLFLVEDANKHLYTLTTNNHGTPYYFPSNQSLDFNSVPAAHDYAYYKEISRRVDSAQDEGKPIEDYTSPLICVSLWSHAYLHDYGVAGREKYIRAVLGNLNWTIVNSRLYSTVR